MADRAQRAVRELLKRVFGISVNDEVTVPIPLARGTALPDDPDETTEPIPNKKH